jgi:hypothetical protein
MSWYDYRAMCLTEEGFRIADPAKFDADLATLQEMFPELKDKVAISWSNAGFVYVFMDEDCGPEEVSVCDVGPWYEQLPPDDWPEVRKRAHAEVHGYLHYWDEIYDTGDDTIDIVEFMMRHMVKDSIAVMHGVSTGDGTCWYWGMAITHDRCEWDYQSKMGPRLANKLKQRMELRDAMRELSVQSPVPRRQAGQLV